MNLDMNIQTGIHAATEIILEIKNKRIPGVLALQFNAYCNISF